jgi:hypothetical protein
MGTSYITRREPPLQPTVIVKDLRAEILRVSDGLKELGDRKVNNTCGNKWDSETQVLNKTIPFHSILVVGELDFRVQHI